MSAPIPDPALNLLPMNWAAEIGDWAVSWRSQLS